MILETRMTIEHADRFGYNMFESQSWHTHYSKWDDDHGGFRLTTYILK